jgi:predicted extracellular nuclease
VAKTYRSRTKVRRRTARRGVLCLLVLALFGGLYLSSTRVRVVEALSVTTLGVPITQSFDTLPASGSATFVNDSTLPGWYSARTGTGTTIVANDGSSNAGNLYSYGTGTNTDRALGSLGSGNAAIGNLFWGIRLTNNTGSTITSLDVTYFGEQWRNSAAAAQTVAFSYLVGSPTVTGSLAEFQSAGVAVPALDFTSPITGGAAAALNGNLAANRVSITSTISGLSIPNGTEIMLRWSDPDHTGADHGLSIDNFSVTPQGGGGGGTTLSIDDVTQVETNAGTTNFNFTVSLSAPAGAGGVTFNASTADGTTDSSDYTPLVNQPGSIASGNTSTTVTVVVNGDPTSEPNETFFVNITNIVGATGGDVQGLGTITNDDFSLTAIHTVQGNGATSPFNGSVVTTSGVVTLLKSNGFFMQEPDASVDADPNTSEGIFVFTSSAPTVTVGTNATATGTVTEFGTGGTITELGSVTSVVVNSTGNPLPAAIPLTPTILDPTALPSQPQLEKFESMRMTGALKTVSPNDTFFDVDTVLTSVTRPIREIGMEISATIPSDPSSTANIPRWDENPERLSVDTNGRAGSTGMALTSNVTLGTVTGVLDFAFAEYHLIPDVDPTPSANMTFVPVPVPLATEFTVGCFNIENFANGATQRQKAARAIRQVMRYPDIIGHEEIATLAGLQALATEISNQAIAAAEPDPMYTAFLTGTGAQNVGFLVKTTRVSVTSVTEEPVGTYINPLTGLPEPLHDRPPLTLRATVDPTGPNPIPVIVVVNHPRSFIDIGTDPGDGPRVRAKRKAQGESIAALLDSLQNANPAASVMTVGDFNAFQFNDGYTDPIATIKGTPTADDQIVVAASADVVSPDLFNLTETLPVGERYSFTFEGTPQALDHVIVNRNALARFTRYAIARFDSDFPDTPASAFVNDASRPEGASDHDAPVAYFNLTLAPTAADGRISGI